MTKGHLLVGVTKSQHQNVNKETGETGNQLLSPQLELKGTHLHLQ